MPAKPAFKTVPILTDAGFRRMSYTEWGSPRAEKTVVCVHGVSRTSRDFDRLSAALAERGARVIAPDLPGRGRSDWLASGPDYSDQAYRNAAASLLARLDVESVDWVGTSLGGHIGMMIAAESGAPIAKLVLNDFGARVSASALRRIGSYLAREWRFASVDEAEVHIREIHAPFGELSDTQWRDMTEHSVVPDGAGHYRFHYDPAIADRFALPLWFDITLWDLWERIECPVLLIRGAESDLLSPATAAEMARRRPEGAEEEFRFVEFTGCGHAPSLTTAERIAAVADFLFDRRQDGPVVKRRHSGKAGRTAEAA